MKVSIAYAGAVLAAAALLAATPSYACTNPQSGADNPTVNEDGPSGADNGAGTGTGTGSESGGGVNETSGGGSSTSSGSSGSSSDGSFTETGGAQSSSSALTSEYVDVNWKPASEVDGDPNNTGYWSHSGHSIATRVQIVDAETGKVVLEKTVSQYDYTHAKQGALNPAIKSYTAQLPSGSYIARVQSVFTRHDEIRYGMSGQWQSLSTAKPPPLGSETASVKFAIRTEPGAISGGCNAVGAAGALPLLALLMLVERRLRAKRS